MTLRLAIRNVLRHKTRSVITLSAIAFGCISLIFVGGFFEDMFFKMRESYIKGHTGHLQIYRRGFFQHGSGHPFQYLVDDPSGLAAQIARLPGVASVTQRLEFAGLISSGETTIACLIQGVEPSHEPTIRLSDAVNPKQDLPSLGGSVIEAGDPLSEEQPYGVLLGRGLAGGIDASPGEGLVLVAHTVDGAINALDVTVAGIFYTSSKAFDDRALRMPLPTAQQLLQTTAVQALVLMLHRTNDTPKVRRALERLIDEQHLDLEVKGWDEISDFYNKTRELFGRMFLILKLVIAVIVVLSIYNTMNMAVVERTTEIGTIMALGAKPGRVLGLFLCEGAVLGGLGGLLGLVGGAALICLVRHIGIPMPPPPGATMTWMSEPQIVPSVMAFAFLLALATALISSLYPAYKASRLEVAEALRHVG